MKNIRLDQQTSSLQFGLHGLSQAMNRNRMSGHPPAAVLAAYFFCKENSLETGVQNEVQQLVGRLVSGSESIWYREDGKSVTNEGLFAGLPTGEPDPAFIPRITKALAASLGACRDSGHNTIFASLALKALNTEPKLAKPGTIRGIERLLEDFIDQGPGWAHVPGQQDLVNPRSLPSRTGVHLPVYGSTADMIAAVCRYVTPNHLYARGVGGPIHIVNHAAAILDLEALGYQDLVVQALDDHRDHLDLWLRLPLFSEDESARRSPNPLDPLKLAYWTSGITLRDQGGYEHRIKFLYGAHRFAAHIQDDGERRKFLSNAALLW